MIFYLKVALRYLFSKRSTNAINIISGISLTGMTVGAWCLVVFLSVFNGFEGLVKSLYNAFYPELSVYSESGKTFPVDSILLNKIRNVEGIAGYSVCLEENAYLKYGDKEYIGTIKGVDSNYSSVSDVDSFMLFGSFLLKDDNYSYAVIGAAIDQALNVDVDHPLLSLEVMVPKKGRKSYINPEDAFRKDFLIPSGVFAIQQEFDSKYVFVPLKFAQELLQEEGRASVLEIKLKPGVSMEKTQEVYSSLLGNSLIVKNRIQQNEVLYRVMKIERFAVYAILTFILLIISFNIIGSLSMLVMEKERDIAILRALGAGASGIKYVYLGVGVFTSGIGALIGLFLGFITCLLQQQFGIIKLQGSGSFVIDSYPVEMHVSDFLLTFITVILISLLASWYPASKAASRAGSLRYA